ncbi:geranyl diphosphate phosphohydrolase isoform X4 [Capsicum chacoense]
MNHKSLFILSFVLIFCLSSTVASRRLLPGNEGIPIRPNHSGTAPSATELPPPQGNKRIPMRPNHSKPDHSATDPHPPQEVIKEYLRGYPRGLITLNQIIQQLTHIHLKVIKEYPRGYPRGLITLSQIIQQLTHIHLKGRP